MPGPKANQSLISSSALHAKGAWTFLRSFVKEPSVVGSVFPSSRFLANALLDPFKKRTSPAKLLEIGAGTGAVTTRIGEALGAEDEFDVVEIQPALAEHLDRVVLHSPALDSARRDGRVRLFACALQDIDMSRRYDFIISGLPLTAFPVDEVQSALAVARHLLKPGGVFSYFEYVALRRLRTLGTFGKKRLDTRLTSRYLDKSIERFQFHRTTVLVNLPPAYVRHWRFDPAR